MSKIEVDAIDKQSGSTLTLGGSGTAVTLACGATQSGFGRAGSVNWQTSIKTTSFTAVSGEGYFVNTTSGEVTVTLPSSPSVGAIVAVKDYANTADTNSITFNRNGSNIDGGTQNPIVNNEGGAVTLVYGDATKGWQIVEAARKSDLAFPTYIVATGGTITEDGNFKVHTFTGPGTFTVCSVGNACGSNTVSYMVVAGGGGGGSKNNSGGGGGAGGFREGKSSQCSYTSSPVACTAGPNAGLPVSAQGYPIVVGSGGSGSCGNCATNNTAGGASSFSTISSAGGGTGGNQPSPGNGGSGGSGGGAGRQLSPATGGAGNTPPVSPPQGNPGGPKSYPVAGDSSGGGGGATATGASNGPTGGGPGGAGATTSINGTPTAFAGGGGGGTYSAPTVAPGGAGGGGNGGKDIAATNGTTNTGGGGGGAGYPNGGPDKAGNGGSGIVIIRYKFQ
jgi:hypothetical protein